MPIILIQLSTYLGQLTGVQLTSTNTQNFKTLLLLCELRSPLDKITEH